MKEKVLAKRYAKALLYFGLEEKALERFRDEVGRFRKALELEPGLLKLLSLRELDREKRRAILRDLMFQLYLSLPIQNFLRFLFDRNRISLFKEIADSFGEFIREIENAMVAKIKAPDIKTAKLFSGDLKKTLEKMTGKRVDFQIEEDKSLIGGLQISLGDEIYDCTITGELERIKEKWI